MRGGGRGAAPGWGNAVAGGAGFGKGHGSGEIDEARGGLTTVGGKALPPEGERFASVAACRAVSAPSRTSMCCLAGSISRGPKLLLLVWTLRGTR